MFFMRTLTLTSANTNYQLWELLTNADPRVPRSCAELQIQAHSTNTSPVLIGDGSLGATNAAKEMATYDSTTVGAGNQRNTISLKNLWARSADANQKINVLVRIA